MRRRLAPGSLASKGLGPLLLACILVLVLAQALVGALSLSALDRLAANNTADRVELSLRQSASQVQIGLDLGKPLAQYFGLEKILESAAARISGLSGASVVLADGRTLASIGTAPDPQAVLTQINDTQAAPTSKRRSQENGAVHERLKDTVRIALPLTELNNPLRGAIIADVTLADESRAGLLGNNIKVLLLTTVGCALLLAVALRFMTFAPWFVARPRLGRAIPLSIVLLAQLAYTGYTTTSFQQVWLQVTQDNARRIATSVQADFERVLSYGIAPDKLVGADDYMGRILEHFSVMQTMAVVDPQGKTLALAGVPPRVPQAANDASQDDLEFRLALRRSANSDVLAWLVVGLDKEELMRGVWRRVWDAATVTIIALVAGLELLRLLNMAMRRRLGLVSAGGHSVSFAAALATDPLLARPIMFGFLFAWALPLGFLPLHARSLISATTQESLQPLLMAAPIAVEMALGLVTALLAGRLSDRRGWVRPVLLGLTASILGSLACAMATSLPTFVAARGLVGAGYGLAWMGLHGFVVLNSQPSERGRNTAAVIAGLFAGHLSGAALGAMWMQQLGAVAVFKLGALLFCVPLMAVLVLSRAPKSGSYQHLHREPSSALSVNTRDLAAAAPEAGPASARLTAWSRLRRLLFSRDFGMLLLGSVIPFSIAQVGLLSFSLPLFLEASGAQTASVGRVLMIYGLCVIYIGPAMGRWADRSSYKKAWIGAAGVVGAAACFSLSVLDGLPGAVVAVFLMAMSGCLLGGSQTAYMLALGRVQTYGAVGATSWMRAFDKIGQVLGPLLIGGLLAAFSLRLGMAVIGVFYLAFTVLFIFVAPREADRQDRATQHAW